MKIFTWDMGYECNYKCEYCFFTQTGWDNIKKQHGTDRSVDEVCSAWENIYDEHGPIKIYITGGEPFLYPGFADIIYKLSKMHVIHVTTNLSVPLEEFILKNDASKVEINSTFHPLKTDHFKFAGNVIKLRKAGFICNVCYLAHPLQLREMLNYKRYFKGLNIDMALTQFCGKYNGKEYPHAYSIEELKLMDITERWGKDQDDMNMLCEERDSSGSINLETNQKSSGACCNAGMDFAVIGVDGSVRPCGQLQGPLLGNIFKYDLKLLELPLNCIESNCRRRGLAR